MVQLVCFTLTHVLPFVIFAFRLVSVTLLPDYAVDIFHSALKYNHYTCFLSPDTKLPMMYLPDCIRATINHLTAPPSSLSQRVYNIAACSFTPAELAEAIREHLPSFTISYTEGDFRQNIADTWPQSLDDSKARKDMGWKEQYGLKDMVTDMLLRLRAQGLHLETSANAKSQIGMAM